MEPTDTDLLIANALIESAHTVPHAALLRAEAEVREVRGANKKLYGDCEHYRRAADNLRLLAYVLVGVVLVESAVILFGGR